MSVFEPPAMAALLNEIGYAEIVHFGPEEAISTYFPGRCDVRFGFAQRLIAGTVMRTGA